MPIQVTCPKCHKRFRVSEKFAGQKGPCPSCKHEIQVPSKEDEVVVHAPEASGPTDSSGRAVLEPIEREDAKFSVLTAIMAAVITITAVVVAFMSRAPEGEDLPTWIQAVRAIGALLIGIPVAKAGYGFLRDDELEPFRGRELWLRTLICATVYAILWGVYGWVVQGYVFNNEPMEIFYMVFVIPLMVAAGGFTALACYELEFLNALLHYTMYLIVTVVLRILMDMPAF